MKSDYQTESERQAYCKGIVAKINGLTKADCPYILLHNKKLWLAGFDEKGSLKDKAK